MRSAKAGPLRLRALRFETCENRIMFSGCAPVDHSLDDLLVRPPENETEQVEVALNDVHDEFGVTYARNAFGFEGQGQTVAVIDTGVAYDHVALGGGLGAGYRVVGGRDFTEENDADPYDDGPAGFHGTHVAGIVGSDSAVYTGVAPGVDIVALRVFNDQGAGHFEWVERALRWVHAHRDDFANPITTVTMSLGGGWNSDDVPIWATLEEELAVLNRDGIFVSVAAGNDFSTYRHSGLSYPAASPYVVPVASVNNNGLLSNFSQRNYRVLAAPGEQITSTVPDYLRSFDGVANDFATASGTSMAAPYVAGASVLVREALEFVGTTNISQEEIYEQLYDTADLVHDAKTGQSYHRINLQQALDAVMPADDFGSTRSAAQRWGRLTAEVTEVGVISRLDDVDYFHFTAGATGVASFAVTASDSLVPDLQLVGLSARADGGGYEFDVVAGRQYVVGIGTSGGIGHYTTRLEISSPFVDLGEVGFVEFAGQQGGGSKSYRFTANQAGQVIVGGNFTHNQNGAVIRVVDSGGTLVAKRTMSGSSGQLGFAAKVGEEYTMTIIGVGGAARYSIGNAFEGVKDSLNLDFGDFTGDGRVDVIGRSAAGHWWVAQGTERGYVSNYAGRWNTSTKWVEVVAGDFNGDGQTQVLGRTAAGHWWVSEDVGTQVASRFAGHWNPTQQWQDVRIDDFTGDGRDDFLARNERGKWFLAEDRAGKRKSRIVGNWGAKSEWEDVIVGDFNGDGRLDVIGRRPNNRWVLAQNTGTAFVNRAWGAWNHRLSWSDVMVGDFTGDGLADIVGRSGTNRWYVAENTGTRFVNRRWGAWNPATHWSEVMTGDFTGDGLPDILGRSAAGKWILAENNGVRFVNRAWGFWNPSAGWPEVVMDDFNGDGLLDLAGRTESGDWYLSRNTETGFVTRPWRLSNASSNAPTTAGGNASPMGPQPAPKMLGPLPAASAVAGFDSWLASDEGSGLAGHLLGASSASATWAEAYRRSFE